MQVSSIVTTATVGAAFAWSAFWTFDRVVSYFTKSQAENLEGFNQVVLPSDGSADPSVLKAFDERALKPMWVFATAWGVEWRARRGSTRNQLSPFPGRPGHRFNERYTSIRFHIASSAVLLSLFILNSTPAIRKRSYKLHRFLGTLSIPLVLITQTQMAHLLFIQGMVPLGSFLFWGNTIAFFGITGGYSSALYGLQKGDLEMHRNGMIVTIASFLVNPVQRLFWSIFGKAHMGGPYKDFQTFLNGSLNPSEGVAVVLNAAVAAYLILKTKPDAADVAAFKRRALSGKSN